MSRRSSDDAVFFAQLALELVTRLFWFNLGFVHKKHGLVRHARQSPHDFGCMRVVEAAEWRVHNNRSAHWRVLLKGAHQRKRDNMLRAGGPNRNRRSIPVHYRQPIIVVYAEGLVLRLTRELEE